MNHKKPTMKDHIISILRDGEWHGCGDLLVTGTSYSQQISQMRAIGWMIESVRDGDRPTFKYKLIAEPQTTYQPENSKNPILTMSAFEAQKQSTIFDNLLPHDQGTAPALAQHD
jgi:hypothetical protein